MTDAQEIDHEVNTAKFYSDGSLNNINCHESKLAVTFGIYNQKRFLTCSSE